MTNPLAALGRFVRPVQARSPRCRLCRQPIAADDDHHVHVVDRQDRQILCACETCWRLLAQPGAGGDRYRAVPTRVVSDPAVLLSETDWAVLGIPVRLAFVFFNSELRHWTAFCPSPAGATEMEVPSDAWGEVSLNVPLLDEVQPDVEALLVYGGRSPVAGGGAGNLEYFLVPVDLCYRLTARLRQHWSGFSGGDDAWREIDQFFAALRGRARALPLQGSAA
ncbi:MAG TPA: DUF5947 family protein [Polyangia bacterium]|jgi:hypothetical protein